MNELTPDAILKRRQIAVEVTELLTGCVLYAVAATIINQANLIPGNFIGIATVCHILFSWDIGVTHLLLSIPAFLFGTLVLGKKMFIYTMLAIVTFSGLVDVFAHVPAGALAMPGWLAVLVAGLVIGVGDALIIYPGGTTGGTLITSRMIRKKSKKISIGNLILMQDVVIIVTGAIIADRTEYLAYSLAYEFVADKMIDLVLYMMQSAKSKAAGKGKGETDEC